MNRKFNPDPRLFDPPVTTARDLRMREEMRLKRIESEKNIMKLDRNITEPRVGKYALIKMRDWPLTSDIIETYKRRELSLSIPPYVIDLGDTADSDFFVIRLKDKYAHAALSAYADAARKDGNLEFAEDVMELALIALLHPSKKLPD